jgi:serine acetyltransferase
VFNVLSFHRVAHALHRAGFRRVAHAVSFAARALLATYVLPEAEIGAGTELGYGGIAVVVHKDAVIGRNVLISPGVVIGGRSGLAGVPVIEDGAKIGSGAKLLRPIRIGAGARESAPMPSCCTMSPPATRSSVSRPAPCRGVSGRSPDRAPLRRYGRSGDGLREEHHR